jgi:tetratricopeptide (TPR) repeat protein
MPKQKVLIKELGEKIKLTPQESEGYALIEEARLSIRNYNAKEGRELLKKASKIIKNKNSILSALIMEEEGKAWAEDGIWSNDLKKIKKAFRKFERALDINPQRIEIRMAWIAAIIDATQFKASFKWYLKQLNTLPTLKDTAITPVDYWTDWGTKLFSVGKNTGEALFFDAAFEKYEACSIIYPKDANVWNLWANDLKELACMRGEAVLYHDAMQKYRVAIELDPTDHYCWNDWLETVEEYVVDLRNPNTEVLKEALDFIAVNQALIPMDKVFSSTLSHVASAIAEKIGDKASVEKSIAILETIIANEPENEIQHMKLGCVYLDLNKFSEEQVWFDKCIALSEKALEINPNFEYGWIGLGIHWRDYGSEHNDIESLKESFKYFKGAIKLNSKNSFSYYHYAAALEWLSRLNGSTSDVKLAVQMYKKAIKLDSTNADIYCDFATVYIRVADRKKKYYKYLKKAFKLYDKAVKCDPNHIMTWSNWGTTLMQLAIRTNDKEIKKEAQEKLKQAVKLGASPYNLA